LNSEVEIIVHNQKLDFIDILDTIGDYDFIIDGNRQAFNQVFNQ